MKKLRVIVTTKDKAVFIFEGDEAMSIRNRIKISDGLIHFGEYLILSLDSFKSYSLETIEGIRRENNM